jgi:hypothetical protein
MVEHLHIGAEGTQPLHERLKRKVCLVKFVLSKCNAENVKILVYRNLRVLVNSFGTMTFVFH